MNHVYQGAVNEAFLPAEQALPRAGTPRRSAGASGWGLRHRSGRSHHSAPVRGIQRTLKAGTIIDPRASPGPTHAVFRQERGDPRPLRLTPERPHPARERLQQATRESPASTQLDCETISRT
jgi:hypothetical protein